MNLSCQIIYVSKVCSDSDNSFFSVLLIQNVEKIEKNNDGTYKIEGTTPVFDKVSKKKLGKMRYCVPSVELESCSFKIDDE